MTVVADRPVNPVTIPIRAERVEAVDAVLIDIFNFATLRIDIPGPGGECMLGLLQAFEESAGVVVLCMMSCEYLT